MFELAKRLGFRGMKQFKADESGAVTIDWVVLSAVVIVFAVGISTLNSGSGSALSAAVDYINTLLSTPPPSA